MVRSMFRMSCLVSVAAAAMVLAACHHSSKPPAPASIVLSRADNGTGTAGGGSTLNTSLNPGEFETIQATVLDASGTPIASRPAVTFSVTGSGISIFTTGLTNAVLVCAVAQPAE